MPRRRILVAGLGALLVLYALTVAWGIVDSDTDGDAAESDRFVVGSVTVVVDEATITLLGAVPSDAVGRSLVDALAARPDVTVVVDRLTIDESAPTPSPDTIHTGLDAVRRSQG